MTTSTSTYTINAAGRPLGRVATEAAKALMGKMSPQYTPHNPPKIRVEISNCSRIAVRPEKKIVKVYQRYSGYPGGQTNETYAHLTARKGSGAALKIAITRMLPRNALRTERLKNLIISE